jgi:hypothetical protein
MNKQYIVRLTDQERDEDLDHVVGTDGIAAAKRTTSAQAARSDPKHTGANARAASRQSPSRRRLEQML